MSARPQRSTRSSVMSAPSSSARDSTQIRRGTTKGADVERTSTAATASSSAARPKSVMTAKTPSSVAKTNSTGLRPLWNSSKINTVPEERNAVRKTPAHASTKDAPAASTPALRAVTVPRKSTSPRTTSKVAGKPVESDEKGLPASTIKPNGEPIKTYLRIRPAGEGVPTVTNYVRIVDDQEVILTPPADHRTNIYGSQLNLASFLDGRQDSASSLGTAYKFTHVFSPLDTGLSSSQSHFFEQTTLPLVHDFLAGENCLLFAYGTTGSGKTWTVQGGQGQEAGLLPRVMDVVCRSLEGKQAATSLKPVGLSNVQLASVASAQGPLMSTPSKRAQGLGIGQSASDDSSSTKVIPVDDSYEYSTWISYAEIYNEKIYDLLDSPVAQPAPSTSSQTSMFSSLTLSGVGAKAKGLMRNLTTVKRDALSLKHDKDGSSKYVHGMKEVRVQTAEEARQLLEKGQNNRRVFSTLANRASSRSHSIFTIKIVKSKKGAKSADPASAQTNMFSLVDLAGSERQINTGTNGDRLKEAGKINTSLMVLGQCMDTLRRNQELGPHQKPSMVPFRHSKLTELFQSFFVGHGKAVMVVNVDPWSTSFDENAHVMKFSAVAKSVVTTKQEQAEEKPAVLSKDDAPKVEGSKRKTSQARIVRVSLAPGADEEDVLYEEEEDDEVDGSDDDVDDRFVTNLLDEVESLRAELYEAHVSRAMAEHRTRTAVSAHYEQKIIEVERYYRDRLRAQAEDAEKLQNAKLDIIASSQSQPRATEGDSSFRTAEDDEGADEEDEVGPVDRSDDGSREEVEQLLLSASANRSAAHPSAYVDSDASPLAAVSNKVGVPMLVEDSPAPAVRVIDVDLSSDNDANDDDEDQDEEAELSDEDDDEGVDESSDDYADEEEEDEGDEDFEPAVSRQRASRASAAAQRDSIASSNLRTPARAAPAARFVDDEEEQDREADEDEDGFGDRSVVVVNKLGSAMKSGKKPKRMLGGSKGMSVDDLAMLADELAPVAVSTPRFSSNSLASRTGSVRSIKRL